MTPCLTQLCAAFCLTCAATIGQAQQKLDPAFEAALADTTSAQEV